MNQTGLVLPSGEGDGQQKGGHGEAFSPGLSLSETSKRERNRESDQGFGLEQPAWVKTLVECLPVYVWAVSSPLCTSVPRPVKWGEQQGD